MHAGAHTGTPAHHEHETGADAEAPTLSVLARNLRRLRKARKLTQAQLAQRLGMCTAHLNRTEVGHYAPSADLIPHLMSALDVSADELFTDPDAMTDEQKATEALVGHVRALTDGQRDLISQAVDVLRLKRKVRILFLPIPQDDPG